MRRSVDEKIFLLKLSYILTKQTKSDDFETNDLVIVFNI